MVSNDLDIYRQLVENTNDIIFSLTEEGIITYISPAWTRLLDYTVEEAKGHSFNEFVHPADLPACFAFLKKILETGDRQEGVEYRVRHKNGDWRWHTSNASPKLNSSGTVVGFDGIARDITERKLAEDLLLAREEHLSATLRSIGDGVLACDSAGQVTNLNNAAEALTGWTSAEAAGQPIEKVFHIINAQTREPAENPAIPTLAKGKSIGLANDTVLIAKNGIERQIADSCAPIRDAAGKVTGAVLVFRDVTDNYLAQKALKESEATYREIFNGISDTIWVHDIKTGHFIDVNSKVTDMFGYSVEEALKLNLDDVSSGIPPYTQQGAMEHFKKALQEGKQVFEWHCRHKDGHLFWTEVTLQYATINGIVRIIAIERDITERKLAADKILHMSSHDQLTGLYNRYYMEEDMKNSDVEEKMPLSIIIADLNGLKLVNDTYGPATGDRMLKRAAAVLKQTCRNNDTIARFGSDEFVVLLPRTAEKETLAICRRISRAFDKEHVEDVPLTISTGAAVKTDINQEVIAVLREAEDKLSQNKLTESRSGKSDVLNTLLKTLAEKSYETEVHTRNMQAVAIKIGEILGLPDSELNRLSLLITLHDIGKINIPEELLTKKGSLTDSEWAMMKKHAETGYRIAQATETFAHVAEDILCHHEHWDGKGYPRGLKGNNIPLLARITAIADAFEVMHNGRPYKKAMTPKAIVTEFKACAGNHFDPQLTGMFLEIIEDDIL